MLTPAHTPETEEIRPQLPHREPTPGDTPVQYYGRSQLPQREVALHRFSPKRKSTLIAASLLVAVALMIATAATATASFNHLATQAQTQTGRYPAQVQQEADGARNQTLTLATAAVAALLVTVYIIFRAGPRIVALEFWIRRMGAGDLNHTVVPTGNDEITELAYDLEVVRRQSVRAQRLDLVEQLSEDLQNKNDQLESVLGELQITQDQVISRQKLAELGELSAGVAHEIRNPLNLIQNFARTSGSMATELKDVLAQLEGPPTPEQAELIDELTGEITDNMARLQHHGGRANRIVQDMLAMGRSSKGNFQTVSINDLVDDHAMLAYHSARSHDPDFNMKIFRDLDPEAGNITAVSEDIGRVILNLVGNACYATTDRTRREPDHHPAMWLATSRNNDWIEITVRDNGSGIPEDIIGKIFNPFFTTKPTDRGTGLGLSLSNDIVRQHGGTIQPESQPGEYAQFTVRLPAVQQVQNDPPQYDPAPHEPEEQNDHGSSQAPIRRDGEETRASLPN